MVAPSGGGGYDGSCSDLSRLYSALGGRGRGEKRKLDSVIPVVMETRWHSRSSPDACYPNTLHFFFMLGLHPLKSKTLK